MGGGQDGGIVLSAVFNSLLLFLYIYIYVRSWSCFTVGEKSAHLHMTEGCLASHKTVFLYFSIFHNLFTVPFSIS